MMYGNRTYEPWRRTVILAIPVLLAGLLSHCTTGRTASGFGTAGEEETVVLVVDNRNSSDAKIYIFPGGSRRLLGEVRARSIEDLSFGWNTVRPLTVEIELVAGRRYRLPPLSPVQPGRLDLVVAEALNRSFFR